MHCTVFREKCGEVEKPGNQSDQEIQTIPSFIPYNLLTQHSIPDKSIADCVEVSTPVHLFCTKPVITLVSRP